ncbi:GNAT family N-acyltransferase [Pseudoalteromonas tunicata]|jgi:putative hemolysin|uniref:L-ornithine N(alpha)-acyltransferase n=1 Tax=Pseudoalteromonas tunicata D2 TaxID=87626 RepID=A4C640_9GAMM|nr:GNAT family N-acyltransferase [Pseudoalteromonas tunicata]ATC95417.1 hypothetical protein PTUN_a3023 [Pseudoalteromonas tunicata]AXT30997.1 GNAT family N-acetyltransferase [Pseudoalteromonas tunicata]EAR29444.1 acyltransferase family protein [Pseudoalteromonas tunicata D2]
MINVENVVENNLPQLNNSPKLKSIVTKGLGYLLHEQEFVNFAAQYPHLKGIEFVEQVLEELEFKTRFNPQQIDNIPTEGKVVIVSNHPIGSLDALALINLLHQVRKDIKVVANRMLMAIEPMHNLLLPVNNLSGNSKKRELANISQHLKNEGALLIFPAGEVSRLSPTGIKDGTWNSGFLRFASKCHAPILPIQIIAKNSPLFYGTSMIYKPLASLLLVQEMFKQRHKSLEFEIGSPIAPEAYTLDNVSDKVVAELIKKQLYRLNSKKELPFKTQNPIAQPECRKSLKQAIEATELLGMTQDKMQIRLYRYDGSSPIFRELGRLREIAFRAVGEGTGKRRDIDKYDMTYQHLVLWDNDQLEIVGAYRLADADTITEKEGHDGLYTASLFNYLPTMQPYFAQGLELGRSFVQPKYWGKRSLDYLWYGIGAFITRYPKYRYLFGPVSISNSLPMTAKSLLVYYYQHYFPAANTLAQPQCPFISDANQQAEFEGIFVGNDAKADFVTLKHLLANMGVQIPTLLKQYSDLCHDNGVQFLSFSVDPEFNYCVDGLVLVDLEALKEQKIKRYLAVHQTSH